MSRASGVSVVLENVSLAFGRQAVLKDVSLSIEPGEFFAFLGPSGSGKSTLLRVIAGFGPRPGGRVLIDGEDVAALPPWKRNLGMVFQNYALWPHLSVRRNVAFGLEERRVKRAEIRRRVDAALDLVGLLDLAERRPSQLSGGQQQRVAIARSLALKPKIILMDEPFSALDEPTRYDMQKLIMDLWHEVEATVMIVTHSIAEATFLGDRVWIMSRGPGRIAREFTDVVPPTREADPIRVQETEAFKEAVAEIGRTFREIEGA